MIDSLLLEAYLGQQLSGSQQCSSTEEFGHQDGDECGSMASFGGCESSSPPSPVSATLRSFLWSATDSSSEAGVGAPTEENSPRKVHTFRRPLATATGSHLLSNEDHENLHKATSSSYQSGQTWEATFAHSQDKLPEGDHELLSCHKVGESDEVVPEKAWNKPGCLLSSTEFAELTAAVRGDSVATVLISTATVPVSLGQKQWSLPPEEPVKAWSCAPEIQAAPPSAAYYAARLTGHKPLVDLNRHRGQTELAPSVGRSVPLIAGLVRRPLPAQVPVESFAGRVQHISYKTHPMSRLCEADCSSGASEDVTCPPHSSVGQDNLRLLGS